MQSHKVEVGVNTTGEKNGKLSDAKETTIDLTAFGNFEAAEAMCSKIIRLLKDHLLECWIEPSLNDVENTINGEVLGLDVLNDPKRSHCSQCDKEDHRAGSKEMRWCSGCYAVRYCSLTCQRAAWKPKSAVGHKYECGPGLTLQSWREHYYAACRMFNISFRMLLANITVSRAPLSSKFPDRLKYRAWKARVTCEEIGAMMARESIRIISNRLGNVRITSFCVHPDCTSQHCKDARKKFEDKGMKVTLSEVSYRDRLFKSKGW